MHRAFGLMNPANLAAAVRHGLPLVSVVMPAYNAERTIARSLHSVLAQSYQNLELVVVDDGSRDATSEIAAQVARMDARVRVLTKLNEGVARARNFGMSRARSELIAPVDSDDLWHPSKLEKQVTALLSAGQDTAFVYSLFRIIDEDDVVVRSAPAYELRGRVLCRHVLVNFVGNGSAMLLRRGAALEFGGYDDSLQHNGAEGCEDLLLQVRMASRYPVEVVPEYLIGYRRRPDSMSSDMHRMARSYIMAFEEMRRECQQVPELAFAWGAAPFIMDQALGAMRRRGPLDALKLVLSALDQDAVGALAHLSTRLGDQVRALGSSRIARARSVLGMRPKRREVPRRHFYEYAPNEGMVHWPSSKLMERRLKKLADIDESLGTGSVSLATPRLSDPQAYT